MARRTAEELSGTPLSLVYIADSLVKAETVERILNELGIDYAVNIEPFMSAHVSIMLGQEHMGLFIYVPTTQYRRCREQLEVNGLKDAIDPELSHTGEHSHGA